MQKQPNKTKYFLLLHLGVLIYSLSVVFSKYAAGTPFFSPSFFLFYGLSLAMLAIYAIVWQQALKGLLLSTAYANRALAMVWSIVFGIILFGETVTVRHLIGVLVILCGVILAVTDDE